MDAFKTSVSKSYGFKLDEYNSDWKWQLLSQLFAKNYLNGVDKSKKVLPKKIHQIWLGSAFPEKYKKWAASWQLLNPDWEYKLWTDSDVYSLNLPNLELYNSISNYGAKSDILRYNILNQFGGIYVDTDFECLKSFEELRYLDFFTGVGYPSKMELYVGIIGCTAHHPIMEQVAREVNGITRDIVATEILNATSSYFFTRNFFDVVNEYKKGIVVFPPEYLYPFPNNKVRKTGRGQDFIKSTSLAIHYWEVSWGITFGRTDWIQGEKFQSISDFTYSPNIKHRDDYCNLKNTFSPVLVKKSNIIYTHSFYVKQLFKILPYLKGSYIIITHNSDENIDDSFEIPENVVKWFAQNVNTSNPKIESIPIGLENSMWDKRTNKMMFLNEQLKHRRAYKNLVYMNHNINTNPKERQLVYTLFEDKSWVTSYKGKNGVKVQEYVNNVFNHKFVLCPEGNGVDTHRLWETLYLGSIPIVKKSINTDFYKDLPICFVNDWSEITEDFLKKEWNTIKGKQWNTPKMYFEYWRNRIIKSKV